MDVQGKHDRGSQHLISVVIPALNAQATIGEQLEALGGQVYKGPWEVILADNGSTDATRSVAESFADRLPSLRLVDASARAGASSARNAGVAAARGKFLAFCDADDRVDSGWLAALSIALDDHEFVAGSIDHDSLNRGLNGSHWKSHVNSLPLALRYKPYALSGNMAVTRDIFEEVGGFPEDLDSVGEDVAFSWKVQLAGHELYFEQRAVVAYRHRNSLGALWRQHRAFGIADAVLYKRFRARGVPAPRLLSVVRAYGRLVLGLSRLFFPRRRASLIRDIGKRWGRILGSIREGVIYP